MKQVMAEAVEAMRIMQATTSNEVFDDQFILCHQKILEAVNISAEESAPRLIPAREYVVSLVKEKLQQESMEKARKWDRKVPNQLSSSRQIMQWLAQDDIHLFRLVYTITCDIGIAHIRLLEEGHENAMDFYLSSMIDLSMVFYAVNRMSVAASFSGMEAYNASAGVVTDHIDKLLANAIEKENRGLALIERYTRFLKELMTVHKRVMLSGATH